MTTDQGNFTTGPLHKALAQWLPLFTRDPFSDSPSLDVHRLRLALREPKSHEAVYKWLRSSRLRAENIMDLLDLANSAENLEVLTKLGRTPPTLHDFDEFIFRRS